MSKPHFNLEIAIATWQRFLRSARSISTDDADELESHLRDEIERLLIQGDSEEEAFKRAVRLIGDYALLEQAYQRVFWKKLRAEHRITDELISRVAMLKNYLKIALRNLLRHKAYTVINIFGLAVGIAFCALIFLYVRDELTYDRFHQKGDRIYRVLSVYFHPDGSERNSNSNHPVPLGPALQTDLPGIEHAVRFKTLEHYVRAQGQAFEESVLYADPTLFNVFTFPLVHGDPTTALADLHAVVLSEHAARKFFGTTNVLGQILQVRQDETFEDFVVTGVAANVPGNSTIQFDVLLPFPKLFDAYARYPTFPESWQFRSIQTYIALAPSTPVESAAAKLPSFYARYYPDAIAEMQAEVTWPDGVVPASFRLQPLRDIHLADDSNPAYSYILSGIALAILLIACINFMTLSIGRSASRTREVGIRKVVGARRSQLTGQFWGEALLLSFLALLLGLLLMFLFLPAFNVLSGKALRIDVAAHWTTGVMLIGLVFVTGLIAGSYPALVLSSFNPIETLTDRFKLRGSNVFTKTLVVVQFALSMFLIVGTLVMAHQLDYVQATNPGYNEAQVVILPTSGLDGQHIAARFRNVLAAHPGIVDVTATSNTLGNSYTEGTRYEYAGKTHTINVYKVETNYLDLLELDLIQGRNFDPNLATDSTHSVLVNEALVRDFALVDPIGQPVPGYTDSPETDPIIIGVVRDHHFQSLYKAIAPMLLTLDPAWEYTYLLVRIRPGDLPGTLDLLRDTWQAIVPDLPFAYSFLDDHMQAQYQDDQRWSRIVRYAAFFAVFIACLGLLGLAALTVTARTKEIGIRKALGASVLRIVALLSKDLIRLVGLGVVLAIPVAYLTMHDWLESFAYRIELSWPIFLMAGLLALLIALLTVSYQSIKAALADPVKSLRYE